MNSMRKEGKPIGADAYELHLDGSLDNDYLERLIFYRLQAAKNHQPQPRSSAPTAPSTYQRLDGASFSGWASSPLERTQPARKSKKEELREKRTRRF